MLDNLNIFFYTVLIQSLCCLVHAQEWNEREGSDYEYLFSTNEMDWFDANESCASQNSNLASIHDTEEHEWINGKRESCNYGLTHCHYWIGYRNQNASSDTPNDKWVWSDGSEINDFNDWDTDLGNEPNGDGDVCAYYGWDTDWYDTECTEKKKYICKRDKEDCGENSCPSNSTCIDQPNGNYCACPDGYTGTLCDSDIDECESNPCKNNGTCINGLANYTCICIETYEGYHCDQDKDECKTEGICKNGGTCQNIMGGYYCECAEGFNGSLCEIDIDECLSSPCEHKGKCIDGVSKFTCECSNGFSGEFCEKEKSEAYVWLLVGGISTLVLCFIILIIVVLVIRKHRSKNQGKQQINDVTELDTVTATDESNRDLARSDSQVLTEENELYEHSPVNSIKRYSKDGELYTAPGKCGSKTDSNMKLEAHESRQNQSTYQNEQPVCNKKPDDIPRRSEQMGNSNRSASNESLYAKEQSVAIQQNPSADTVDPKKSATKSPSTDSLYSKEQSVNIPKKSNSDSVYSKEQGLDSTEPDTKPSTKRLLPSNPSHNEQANDDQEADIYTYANHGGIPAPATAPVCP